MKKTPLVSGALLVAAAVATYLFETKDLSLVAKSSVPIFASVEESMAAPPPKPIGDLQPGQSVSLSRCIDVKHYLVYEVRLPDGRTGYVNVGDYAIVDVSKKPASC